jgi:hypothetical protein
MLSALVLSNFVDISSYQYKFFHLRELIMLLISLTVVGQTFLVRGVLCQVTSIFHWFCNF